MNTPTPPMNPTESLRADLDHSYRFLETKIKQTDQAILDGKGAKEIQSLFYDTVDAFENWMGHRLQWTTFVAKKRAK